MKIFLLQQKANENRFSLFIVIGIFLRIANIQEKPRDLVEIRGFWQLLGNSDILIFIHSRREETQTSTAVPFLLTLIAILLS